MAKSSPSEVTTLSVVETSDLGVDRANKTIVGAKVIEVGQLNDIRPWKVDQDTLEQTRELMARPNKGIKARFTHAAAKGVDGLTTHLGRWMNPRVDGDVVRADLKLADAASKGPSGDLAEYLMTLAEEDPESFGVSLAPVLDPAMFSMEQDDQGLVPIRIESLYSVDVVGDPAATRGGLFSMKEEPAMAPDSKEPEAPTKEELATVDQQEQDTKTDKELGVNLDHVREEAKPYMLAFGDQGAKWYLEGMSLVDCYKAKNDQLLCYIVDLENKVAELQVQVQAAEQASGEQEPLSSDPKQEVDTQVLARQARIEELKKKGADETAARWAAMFHKPAN